MTKEYKVTPQIRINTELYDKLVAQAEKNKRSTTKELEAILEQLL